MKNNKRPIFSLLWVMLFDHISLNLTFPILTLLFFDLQSSLFSPDTSHAVRSMWYGLCVAIPHVINIIMTPILSGLSDEFGRKKILSISTFGALVFSLTAALGIVFGTLSLLFVGFIIKGAFSRTNPIAQAVIGDLSERQEKVIYMGYLQTTISIGAFIGPVIGGYFANQFLFSKLNFSLPFFIAALFGGISWLLACFLFQETLIERQNPKRWSAFNFQTFKSVFSNPDVLRISAILLLSQISWSLYYQFIPPILKTQLNFNAHHLGLFVGLIAFWLAIAASLGIKILERFFSLRQMLMISIYLVFIGLLLTFLFCFLHLSEHWNILIWAAAIPIAVGDVIAYTCLTALYSNAVEKHEQGKVMGVCLVVVALMWSLTGLLGGILMSIYILLPLVVAPIGILLAIGLLHSPVGKKLLI